MHFLTPSSRYSYLVALLVLPISAAIIYQQYATRAMAPKLAAIRVSNKQTLSKLPGSPVVVFVGGTSGIGQGMAELLAKYRNGSAHIVLVGRNKDAAERIISHFPKPPADYGWTHEFVQCDATLMKNVHRASQGILAKYPKINFLVLTPGFFSTQGRDETSEGIDKKLALHYYARWKFIRELVPALQKAKDDGEEARALSVLAAGRPGKVDLDDLDLKKGYSVRAAAGAALAYNDYMIESFAERYPGITFAHSYPGLVMTNLMTSSRSPWMQSVAPFLTPLLKPFGFSMEESAEYMWHGLLSGDATGGSHRFWKYGDVLPSVQYSTDEETRRRVWLHTEEMTTVKV